jgi:hypothetical protein
MLNEKSSKIYFVKMVEASGYFFNKMQNISVIVGSRSNLKTVLYGLNHDE